MASVAFVVYHRRVTLHETITSTTTTTNSTITTNENNDNKNNRDEEKMPQDSSENNAMPCQKSFWKIYTKLFKVAS